MAYKKENPRITVKFINSDTEEELFELNNRNQTNIGEIFSDYVTTSLIENELKNKKKKLPSTVLVMAVCEFNLKE